MRVANLNTQLKVLSLLFSKLFVLLRKVLTLSVSIIFLTTINIGIFSSPKQERIGTGSLLSDIELKSISGKYFTLQPRLARKILPSIVL
jgi:hypothetical protein